MGLGNDDGAEFSDGSQDSGEWGEEALATFTAQLPGTPSDGMGADVVLSPHDAAIGSSRKEAKPAVDASAAIASNAAGSSKTSDGDGKPATSPAAHPGGLGDLPSKASLGVSSWGDHPFTCAW